MNVSVLGLGYVGTVTAACLAQKGHSVTGVDISLSKIQALNGGQSPIVEEGVDEIIRNATAQGTLSAIHDTAQAIHSSDLTLVCVGTPSNQNGSADYSYLARVCEQIGDVLAEKPDYHIVVIRSTILPGTMQRLIAPLLEQRSGKKAGIDFGLSHNPEFMREGSAVKDFYAPCKTVIGASDRASSEKVASLYSGIDAPLVHCSLEVAEMIKYADNAWHATKVTFANEIGNFCKSNGIDSHELMDIFCMDTKLNLSPTYLKPGFAFGGSCLPKDVRALSYRARTQDVAMPLIESLLLSNQKQVDLALRHILATGNKRIGVLGISFKAGTDDIRESPMVDVVEHLLGKGREVVIYDPSVSLIRLIGANRAFLYNSIPHIERLMVDSIEEVLEHAELIIIGNSSPQFSAIASQLRPEQQVIDLVRIKDIEQQHANYEGLCW